MLLYLNASDFTIESDKGLKLSLKEAKKAVESGKVEDCNLSFQQLISFDYDVEKLKELYATAD